MSSQFSRKLSKNLDTIHIVKEIKNHNETPEWRKKTL